MQKNINILACTYLNKFLTTGIIISFLATLIFVANAAPAFADEIRIGAFNDLSGATSDVGRDYALGIAEAIRYVNDEGGVNGKLIKLYQYDYGYRIPEVHAKYKNFSTRSGGNNAYLQLKPI